MPIDIIELLFLPANKKVTDASKILDQQKVRFLFFATIATRLNIVFAVSRLCNLTSNQEASITKPQAKYFII